MRNLSNLPDSTIIRETDVSLAEANRSGVSWAAVIGGAFVIASISLLLLVLGVGLGLSSVSPWAGSGASATTVGALAILWFVAVQVIASAFGGYLSGRLRTKWTSIHTDEVYFRDTAHGFLAWALAAVMTAAFLSTAAAGIVSNISRSEQLAVLGQSGETVGKGYYVDRLFHSDMPALGADASARAEAEGLLAHSLLSKNAPPSDRGNLVHLVANRAGLSQSDAESRVDQVLAESKMAMETARKAGVHLSIWTFIALLAGAFSASLAATIGGRQRDRVAIN